ncbi:MAG: antitoxin Xre/MbcA/ParS toxin-binding domain-containing protein [Thermoanaerobaculia bacterium]
MTAAATIFETLGGPRVLHMESAGLPELGETVREGLPYAALEAVMGRLGLSREQVAEALHLPQRTLARRKKEHRLHPDESDRLFRLARIAAQATEVLGSPERAATWLQRPNRALGGRVPLKLLDTDAGSRQVESVLGRIEHGVYS